MNSFRAYIRLGAAIIFCAAFLVFMPEELNLIRLVKVELNSFAEHLARGESLSALKTENLILKSRLSEVDLESPIGKQVGVYSVYPFSDKAIITIAFGEKDGAAAGMPVVTPEGALVGKISRTRRTQSEVETIFNKAWAAAVFIGRSKIEGVLRGGAPPRIDLVDISALIAEGDPVVNSSPALPLGAPVGEIKSVQKGEGEFFADLAVEPFLNLDSLKTVVVVNDFP